MSLVKRPTYSPASNHFPCQNLVSSPSLAQSLRFKLSPWPQVSDPIWVPGPSSQLRPRSQVQLASKVPGPTYVLGPIWFSVPSRTCALDPRFHLVSRPRLHLCTRSLAKPESSLPGPTWVFVSRVSPQSCVPRPTWVPPPIYALSLTSHLRSTSRVLP